jgi:hypothetical protein
MQRWERRERKKQAEREKMPKSGMSVRLIQQIIAKRAAEAKAKAEREQEQTATTGTRFAAKRQNRR